MNILADLKRVWAPSLTGILALALIVGGTTVAQSSTHSQSTTQSQSSIQSSANWANTAILRNESLPGNEVPTTTLTPDEIEALTDSQIDAILTSSAEDVKEAQLDFAEEASPADYALAVAAYDSMSAELDALIASGDIGTLSTTTEDLQQAAAGALSIQTVASRCLTVYKWQMQTIGWIAIGYGAFISIVGLFASGTVIGLPAGAVLGAMGIGLGVTGTFFLWKADHLTWNSKRICW